MTITLPVPGEFWSQQRERRLNLALEQADTQNLKRSGDIDFPHTFKAGRLANSTIITLADDATPSVAGGNLFKTGGTTTITDLDDGVLGQTISILSAHAITITDGTNILLNGSANFVMAAGDTLTLAMFDDGVWEELARKVN